MRTIATLSLCLGLLLGSMASAQYASTKTSWQQGPAPSQPQGSTSSYSQPGPARLGHVRCQADENGVAASASIVVRRGDQSIAASGSCSSAFELAAGTYLATITLETAMDRPSRIVRLDVRAGAEAIASATFQTAIFEVRFFAQRQAVHGMAVIRRDGREIGTVGNGVVVRLSAGTYDIAARYRTQERTYRETLTAGQRRALRADF